MYTKSYVSPCNIYEVVCQLLQYIRSRILYRGGEKKRSLDSWTVLQGFLSDRAQSWRPARGLVKHLPVMFLRESELSAHRTTGISESTTFQNWEMLHVPALRMGLPQKARSAIAMWAVPQPIGPGLSPIQIKRKLFQVMRIGFCVFIINYEFC